MLTIKNLTWTGLETLHMAEEVSYHPGEQGNPSGTASNAAAGDPNTYAGSLVMYLDRGEWHQIHDGNVYVMNDKGATVANYRLGAPKLSGLSGAIQGGISGGAIGVSSGLRAA